MAENVFQNAFLQSAPKESAYQHIQTSRTVGRVKKMTVEELITEFPRLAKSGEFVHAMVTAHGHRRGRKIYTTIDKVLNQPLNKKNR